MEFDSQPRFFDEDSITHWHGEQLLYFIVYPICGYLIWTVPYMIIHFLIFRKWVFEGCFCLYNHVAKKIKFMGKLFKKSGKCLSPFIFILSHFTLFVFTCFLSFIVYWNYYVALVYLLFIHFSGYWHGSLKHVRFYAFKS